jgi:soluble lytic murein transglycosylase-like protein
MTNELGMRRFAGSLWSVVIRCIHGGLLTTGTLVTVVAAALLFGGNLQALGLTDQWRERILSADALVPPLPRAVDNADDGTALDSSMRAVVDYICRRYRVSAVAVEPLVRTAQSAARAAGIDPLLVIAVIGVESSFNPLSESVVGAQGLMQVIGRYHPEKVNTQSDRSALLDPVTNIQVGVLVLRESIRRAGSVEAGLQQYNGAPDDPDLYYAHKVLAERQRLELAARRRHSDSSA